VRCWHPYVLILLRAVDVDTFDNRTIATHYRCIIYASFLQTLPFEIFICLLFCVNTTLSLYKVETATAEEFARESRMGSVVPLLAITANVLWFKTFATVTRRILAVFASG
jgi:hypothetical protein